MIMTANTTFLVPHFDKSVKDKVNDAIEITSSTSLCLSRVPTFYVPAIASKGISCKTDNAAYAFAMKIDQAGNGDLTVGFTDVETYDSRNIRFKAEWTCRNVQVDWCKFVSLQRNSLPRFHKILAVWDHEAIERNCLHLHHFEIEETNSLDCWWTRRCSHRCQQEFSKIERYLPLRFSFQPWPAGQFYSVRSNRISFAENWWIIVGVQGAT